MSMARRKRTDFFHRIVNQRVESVVVGPVYRFRPKAITRQEAAVAAVSLYVLIPPSVDQLVAAAFITDCVRSLLVY